MNLEKMKRGLRHKLGRYTSEDYCNSLRDRGLKVGINTVFFDYETNVVDTQRPWLVEIGAYCKICRGVIILSHDYCRSVLRRVYGEVIAEAGRTVIGDNVFIGINSIILMGAHIGNNVIIGAGSVVTGFIPDNSVAAGNPARVICSLDEFYEKRKSSYIEEAKLCAREFRKRNHRNPDINDMGAFFPLYLKRSIEELKKYAIFTKFSGDEEEDIIQCFLESEPLYDCYEDFLKVAIGENNV